MTFKSVCFSALRQLSELLADGWMHSGGGVVNQKFIAAFTQISRVAPWSCADGGRFKPQSPVPWPLMERDTDNTQSSL